MRLLSEMSERKKVASLLRDFIQSQRGLLIQAENRLQVRVYTCIYGMYFSLNSSRFMYCFLLFNLEKKYNINKKVIFN